MAKKSTANKTRTIDSLAISGQCSSGKSTLCNILSKELGWKHVDIGSEFRKIASNYNIKIENFGIIPDKSLREIDERIQHKLRNRVNVVWDGRLACYLARDQERIYKIYCTASQNVRANRSAKRENVSLDQSKTEIINRDKEEAEVFTRLYGFSIPYNRNWIDLDLDTSSKSPEKLTKIVLEKIKRITG